MQVLAIVFGTLLISDAGAHSDQWAYVSESSESGFTRPVSRTFTMSQELPVDLESQVEWRGERQWYTQVRYGNEASVRVIVVVDPTEDGGFDLYVDRNRDRVIQQQDLIAGEGREREFDLIAEVAQEEFVREYHRRVRFRLGIAGNQFSLGTTGFVAGTTARGETRTPVRLVDGDVNGLFADDRDRIWVDVDNNGFWDPIAEQFPFRPLLVIDERRWAVRVDRVGSRFALEEVTGVGDLKLTVSNLPASARVLSFAGMVYAEDGSAYAVRGLDEPLSVPVGRYTPQSLTLVIDNGERQPWYFSFSRSSAPTESDWLNVEPGEATIVDAIGELRLSPGIDGSRNVKPGASIQLRPRLYTGHGLLINMSCRGHESAASQSERYHNQAKLTLVTENGLGVANATSGFA